MKYKVDERLSGTVRLEIEERMFVEDVFKTMLGGKALLEDEDYIKKHNVSEEYLNDVAQQIAEAEKAYLVLLNDLVGTTDEDEEDAKEAQSMIRMLAFDSEGELGLLVLEGTRATNDEELLKFVNAKIMADDNEDIYVEIDE